MRSLRFPRPRAIHVTLALSIALHVLMLSYVHPPANIMSPGPVAQRPMTVEIRPAPQAAEVVAEAPPQPQAPPPVERPAPRSRPLPPPKAVEAPPVATTPVPAPAPAEPAPRPEPPTAPPVDMLAMIQARQAQRRAAEAAAARGSPAPQPPSPPDALARNLESLSGREGVGGVFSILRVGTRSGEFAFNGWRPESHRQWREVIEVEARPGESVELALVRRMIQLIRTHYTGDFNWESHRLQRVVLLSARPEDNDGLEDFLMREFFGQPVLNPRR